MDNSINFRGAFLIKQPAETGIREQLFPILGKRHQIIPNMSDKADVLYVVRDSFDKGIAEVLLNTKNAKFKYYPNLNTKSGFDDEKPLEAKKILRASAKKFIDTKQKLENFFMPRFNRTVDIVKVQAENLRTVQKATFIDVTGSGYKTNIDHQSGVCSVYTMVKNRKSGKKNIRHTLISITPPDKYGISYARITPVSQDDSVRRFAIKNGEVIFEYKEPGSKKFIQNEIDAKRHYLDKISKYKKEMETYRL